MANQLTPGELIVAKGKVAKVKQVFSDKTIRVTIVDSGEVILVSARDIQRIPSVTAINGSDHGEGLNVNDYTVDQLSLAAERFEIIRKWKVEGGVVTKYCSLLGAVAGAECNTVIGLKLAHHAAQPWLPASLRR